MDDDEAESRLLSKFIKSIASEEKAVSLLMKQKIANNKDGTDEMLMKYFPVDADAVSEMVEGYGILFEEKSN